MDQPADSVKRRIIAIWHILTNGAVFEDLGDASFYEPVRAALSTTPLTSSTNSDMGPNWRDCSQLPESAPDENTHRHQRQVISCASNRNHLTYFRAKR